MRAEKNNEADEARIFEEAENNRDPDRLLTVLGDEGMLPGDADKLRNTATTLRLSGRYAVLAPLAETVLARWLLATSGLPLPNGWLTVAPVREGELVEFRREGDGWRLSGELRGVPFAREAERLVVAGRTPEGESAIAALDPTSLELSPGKGLSGEGRDDASLEGVYAAEENAAHSEAGAEELLILGALARSLQMAGAMEKVLEFSISHAKQREQFGRPIGRFQAIQHHLAVMAGETAAASAAADAAALALENSKNVEDAAFEVAAAKVRVGEAAEEVARISHQVHGAIGFTKRHALHHYTRRLWTWRDEFGSESEWSVKLGEWIFAKGSDGLWPTLARTAGMEEEW